MEFAASAAKAVLPLLGKSHLVPCIHVQLLILVLLLHSSLPIVHPLPTHTGIRVTLAKRRLLPLSAYEEYSKALRGMSREPIR